VRVYRQLHQFTAVDITGPDGALIYAGTGHLAK
jgi:hypothetical protein